MTAKHFASHFACLAFVTVPALLAKANIVVVLTDDQGFEVLFVRAEIEVEVEKVGIGIFLGDRDLRLKNGHETLVAVPEEMLVHKDQ